MPDILLPSENHAPEYQLVLTTTSTAVANGIEVNSATARLSGQGRVLGGQLISFTLSGNAVFTQGGQQVTAVTDTLGEATVFFTDIRCETVLVTGQYCQIQAREDSRFIEDRRADVDMSGEVLQNGSWANGAAANAMRYTVYDNARRPIPNILLAFSSSGNALLSASSGTTDPNGQFTLKLTNRTVQQVLVSARLPDFPGIENNTFLSFIAVPQQFVLGARATNNGVPANGSSFNTLIFQLTSNNNPAAGFDLAITTNSSTAMLSFPQGTRTNQNGEVVVNITNTVVGQVTVTAGLVNPPGLPPAPVTSSVTFTQSQLYIIANEVTRDYSPANGTTPNQVIFTVIARSNGAPQANVNLLFSVTNNAQLSSSHGFTSRDGTYTLNLTNNIVGQVRVTARVQTEPLTHSNIDLTFV